jgi:hypothetical protein
MARYTQNYVVTTDPEAIHDAVANLLSNCSLSVSYVTADYIMAQEKSGKVNFSKLVTVEVLIHQPSLKDNSIKLTCIAKNGELPLRIDNHCQKISELVNQAFLGSKAWQLLETSQA